MGLKKSIIFAGKNGYECRRNNTKADKDKFGTVK
jgi:hypothetical protein